MVKGFTFGTVAQKEAWEFIKKYEWLGNPGAAYRSFGIWKGDLLYGVELFGNVPYFVSRLFPHDVMMKVLLLARGACCLEAGPNAASLLIGASLRELKRQGYWLVVAYSDERAGENGGAYRAAGAKYAGESNKHGLRYVKIDDKWYSPTGLYQKLKKRKHRGQALLPGIDHVPQPEEIRIDRAQKKRWIWMLDSHVAPYVPKSWSYERPFQT
jgi:hypothetical protein